MRPEAKVWRKHWRAALKGVPAGRRSTHKVKTQEPNPAANWTHNYSREWLRRWLGGA